MASTTDLINAAKRGDKNGVLGCLQRGADIQETDKDLQTALDWSITNNHADVAITLLEKGANPNYRPDFQSATLLMWACRLHQTGVASLLINKGASVNDCDFGGYTALIVASERGLQDIALKLIKNGAQVNATEYQNQTSLHWASKCNHPAVLRVLLANGADVNVVNVLGETALDIAKKKQYSEIENLLKAHGQDIGTFKEMRQLIEALQSRVIRMIKSRRVNDERLAGRINELENGKKVMETKIENLLKQNSYKDRQLTELKTRVDGIEESRRVNDERLAGRIYELENEMETKIENLLRQNSIKDRLLTELKTGVDGIEESRRVNDEKLAGIIKEIENGKNVMETKIENVLRQNAIKDQQYAELKTQIEQTLIQNNQIELERRLEILWVEIDEMKRDTLLKEEKLDQLKNATEALVLNRITYLPDSSLPRVLSKISDGWAELSRLTTRGSEYFNQNGEEEIEQQQSHGESTEFGEQMEQLLANKVGGYDRDCQNQRTSQGESERSVGFSSSSIGFALPNEPRSSIETARVRSGSREEIEGHFSQISEIRDGPKPGERPQGQEVNRDRGVRSRRFVQRRQGLRRPAQETR